MKLDVDVQYATNASHVPDEQAFTQWVTQALQGHREVAELTIRIVDAKESASLNEHYRHKHGATNVLSFPFQSPEEVQLDLLGDIVICAEVVEKEALEQDKSFDAHWAHLTIHGVLHLLGYDHITSSEASEMESFEIQVLQQLGYENPYELQ